MIFRLVEGIDNQTLYQARKFAEGIKHSTIDMENRQIVIPFDSKATEADLMEAGMLGDWYKKNGFNVSFRKGDFEYTTQDRWMNYRGWVREKGHKAYLRNRLIMTVTW